jgi:hypothetical protein
MVDKDNILPILNPADWDGRKRAWCRRLVDTRSAFVPWVAYGVDSDKQIAYLTEDVFADALIDQHEADEISVRNLSAIQEHHAWQPETIGEGADAVNLLLRGGDDLTASGILSPAILRDPQIYFESQAFLVGIPNRFSMVACDMASAAAVAPLIESIYHEAQRDEHAHMSPHLFCISHGKIIGLAATPDDETLSEPL